MLHITQFSIFVSICGALEKWMSVSSSPVHVCKEKHINSCGQKYETHFSWPLDSKAMLLQPFAPFFSETTTTEEEIFFQWAFLMWTLYSTKTRIKIVPTARHFFTARPSQSTAPFAPFTSCKRWLCVIQTHFCGSQKFLFPSRVRKWLWMYFKDVSLLPPLKKYNGLEKFSKRRLTRRALCVWPSF